MGELRVIGRQGDSKVVWNSENAQEVGVARKVFEEYRSKGFTAFATTKAGRKGNLLVNFDPQAEEILFVPPMAGG